MTAPVPLAGLAAALGVGLLIGLERERRKGAGGSRTPGGVRTFAIASLAGAVAVIGGGGVVLASAVLVVGVLAAFAYVRVRDQDPGLTTEVALVAAVLLGGLAVSQPALAVGLGVVTTVLLAMRDALHGFARATLTDREMRDGLVLATAALVVWPLLPDRAVDPLGALNLHSIWAIVVLVMGVGAIGHAGARAFGAGLGLPFVGLASGFASSTATIGAMGARAKERPALLLPAVAGAALSTVATFVQLAILLAAVGRPVLAAAYPVLLAGGAAALAYGGVLTVVAAGRPEAAGSEPAGRALDPRAALALAGVVAAILVVTALLQRWLGSAGLGLAAAVAGLADVHAAATAVATVVGGGGLEPRAGMLPLLAAITTNTLSKIVMAMSAGRDFALRVVPGLLLVAVAAWIGGLAAGVLG